MIREVKTFAENEFTEAGGYGLVLNFASGGSLYADIVRGTPPGGDDRTADEPMVEGDPPTPVPLPALELVGGKIRTADIEQYLRALIINSGNREISQVHGYSTGAGKFHKYGLAVTFHRGDVCYVYFLQTLPAGRAPRKDQDYRWLEAM
ncbi:hypothetical protein [Parafrankia sp. EUN1f]|uniref:hypothetical protein n=1 Tax=Parafrankia sp. EUN1f TaxID=102897 RepID=UPI0002D2EEC4|nr:hypothetical protein [Parafrankia sp. EUN1f]